MTWIAAELIFFSWIVLGAIWVWRRGVGRCLHAGAGVALAWLTAGIAALLCDFAMSVLGANFWLRLTLDALLGSAAFVLVSWRWRRGAADRSQRWQMALAIQQLTRPLLVVLLLIWITGNLLIWVLGVNLVAAARPDLGLAARNSSLMTWFLLGTPAADWDHRLAQQQEALKGLSGGIDRILTATGTRQVMELMDAAHWIVSLSNEERASLVAASPELQRLVDASELQAVVADPRLMRLVDEAAHGSIGAVYALGDEPAIAALIASPEMAAALRAIDPVALRRRAIGAVTGAPVRWELSTIGSSLGLDAQLADPAGWVANADDFLSWTGTQRFGVARTIQAETPTQRRLQVVTAAEFSAWFGDELLRPEGRAPLRVLNVPAGSGTLILLLDFAGATERTCLLRWLD